MKECLPLRIHLIRKPYFFSGLASCYSRVLWTYPQIQLSWHGYCSSTISGRPECWIIRLDRQGEIHNQNPTKYPSSTEIDSWGNTQLLCSSITCKHVLVADCLRSGVFNSLRLHEDQTSRCFECSSLLLDIWLLPLYGYPEISERLWVLWAFYFQ